MSAFPELFETMAPGMIGACQLAEVVSVKDDDHLNRVQVKLFAYDGVDGQDGPIWARVATPFAGNNYGAFMLPNKGDEVLVAFVGGDPRFPVVVGSLWNGAATAPDTLGGSGDKIDRWTLVGKAGTRIAIVEEQSGQATITLKTPGEVSAVLKEESGGKIEIKAAGNTVTIDTQGVSVQASAKVKVQASQVEVSAGMVKVDSAMSKFSGMVKCDVLQATTVIATTYTPGAGNIW
jgi:uncharacterized protein involved in type VI secretion and phage assembly